MTDGLYLLTPDLHASEWEGWQPAPVGVMPAPHGPLAQQSAKRGRIAMVMAICVIAVSMVWSVLVGVFATTVYQYNDVSPHSAHAGFSAQPNLVAAGFQILLGSVFGIWALVQGIVATARNEGRSFGIAAMIIAGAAPLLSLIVWIVVGVVAGTHVTQ